MMLRELQLSYHSAKGKRMKRLTCKICNKKKYINQMNDFFYGSVRVFVLCDKCKKDLSRQLITIQPLTEDGFTIQYIAEKI